MIDLTKKATIPFSFFEYPQNTLLKIKVSSLQQLKLTYPEELILSYLWASDQAWLDALYINGSSKVSEKHLNESKNMDPDSNYLILSSKVTQVLEGKKYCTIKYYIKETGKKPLACTHNMQELNGRWYFAGAKGTNNVSSMMWCLAPTYVSDIFRNRKSSSPIIDQINKTIYKNNILDLDKIEQAFSDLNFKDSSFTFIKDPYLRIQ